jgi:hypothetical protein
MTLKKVLKGESFDTRAETWNAFIDAANYTRNQQMLTAAESKGYDLSGGVVLVRNKSGSSQPQFAILGVDDLIIKPTDAKSIQKFRTQKPVFDVKTLADTQSDIPLQIKNFVILQEPIKADALGKAMISGITPVKLDVKDSVHQFAKPMKDDSTKLESFSRGPCRILWSDESSWAIVSFPVGGSPGIMVRNSTGSTLTEGCACIVDAAGGEPWSFVLRKPSADNQMHVIAYSGDDLESGKTGFLQNQAAGEVMRFAVDGDVSAGDFVGSQSGSFRLAKNKFGFLVIATESVEGGSFAYVRYSGLPLVVKAVSEASGGSVSVKRATTSGGSDGDSFTLPVIPEES